MAQSRLAVTGTNIARDADVLAAFYRGLFGWTTGARRQDSLLTTPSRICVQFVLL